MTWFQKHDIPGKRSSTGYPLPREVTRWVLRKAGVVRWLVSAVMATYDGALTVFRTLDHNSYQRGRLRHNRGILLLKKNLYGVCDRV